MRWLLIAAFSVLLVACSSNDDGQPSQTTDVDLATSTQSTSAPTEPPDATATAEPTEAPDPTPEGGHDADRAFEDIEVLAGDIGPRVAGSEAEEAAIEHIAAEFEAAGYDVEVLTFTFPGERFPSATIDLGGQVIDANPLNGSDAGDARGPAVDIGRATAGDLEGVELEGAVAIAHRGETTFRQMHDAAVAAGAVGLVIVNDAEGPFDGALEVTATIPVAAVGSEASDALKEASDSGEEIEITVSGAVAESANVLARAPGTEECRIIAGAHHDTVPLSPGAHDNASGVANVLELARSFAADGFDEGLCFATFGAEESGLYGSAALVETFASDGGLPNYMVNFDVTGIGDTISLTGDAELVALATGIAADLAIDAAPGELPPGSSSDHVSFIEAGVPAVFLFSLDYDTIHTPEDQVEDIELAELDRAGDLGHALILALMEGSDVAP